MSMAEHQELDFVHGRKNVESQHQFPSLVFSGGGGCCLLVCVGFIFKHLQHFINTPCHVKKQ